MNAADNIDTPTRWFLKADDGRSTIRIAPGLHLAEDEEGEVILHQAGGPESLVRFDVRGDDLWVSVVSPDWQLRGCGKLMARVRAEPHMMLRLPNNRFHLTTNIIATPANGVMNLRLVPRKGRMPAAPPPVLRERAPLAPVVPRPATVDTAAMAEGPGDVSAWRWLMPERADTASAEVAATEPEAVAASVDAGESQVASVTVDLPPAASALPDAGPPNDAQRPAAQRRRSARRRRRDYSRRLNYFLATGLIGALTVLLSSPAYTPLEDDAVMSERLLLSASEPIQPILDEAEALLQEGRIDDEASLAFAVEAYRAASQYGYQDDEHATRLAELEQHLARVASR